jgi:hypothetical protein
MKTPSNALACRTLFLQAADNGRGPVLFGDNGDRACKAVLPFLEGVPFPEIYLEFPLAGDPFLDVTLLYGEIKPGTRFDSPAAAGTEEVIDWFAGARAECAQISFGYELDIKENSPGPAAVHFQPRSRRDLVMPFCRALGREDAGLLYTDLASRMPEGWPLSFFGLFRGRPDSPLRVCGYMDYAEKLRCAEDPSRLKAVFSAIGFRAWDDLMLSRIAASLAVSPCAVDFQFDILPDGTFGTTFALDIGFRTEPSETIRSSFLYGPFAEVMNLFESWGAADSRWKLVTDISLTRSIPVEDEEGKTRPFALVLQPHWIKIRWTDSILQKSKMYCLAHAGLVN